MRIHHLQSPLENSDIKTIKLGDLVYFSGLAFTCRSRLHKYVFDKENLLPFSTKQKNILIHAGPVVRKVNDGWKLISFMPTSSIRFEKWGPRSVKEWELKAIVGKTTMGKATALAMKEAKCIHLTPQCVSPNLWLDSIEIEDVFLLKELGSIEAAWQLKLDELGPFFVDIDSDGNRYFKTLNKEVNKRIKRVYQYLNIPDDFEYTKLY